MVKGPRLGDRADGNFSQLVGGVEAEGDAVDLGHIFFALLRAAARAARRGGVSTSGVQCSAKASLSRAAVLRFAAHASAGLPGSARRALRNAMARLAAMQGKKAALLLAVLVWLYASLR